MKVLIIPEDQTLDAFIAKPVVEALLADLGIPARVDVLPEPRLRGAGDALDKAVVAEIVANNPMTDLFVLVVDRDCNRQKNEERAREREAEHAERLVACVAVQELEVWLLALHHDKLPQGTQWRQVRAECDPKERWANGVLAQLGTQGPGGGRKRAMRAVQGGGLKTLLSRCDEVRHLREALRVWSLLA